MRRKGEFDHEKGFIDFSNLKRQARHRDAPLWVCPNGDIYLEAFSPFYQKAKDFLQQCSEPKYDSVLWPCAHFFFDIMRFAHNRFRPQFIHKYSLNVQSIYSAVSVGLSGKDILTKLRIFSKLEIPESVTEFVTKTADACGKIHMTLSKGKYFLESESQAALLKLLSEPTILEDARRAIGGARLSPQELIRSKEVNFSEETDLSDRSIRELEMAVTSSKAAGNDAMFDNELLMQAESYVMRIFREGQRAQSAAGGVQGVEYNDTKFPISVDELVERVMERFQSRQVSDIKSALQLLEQVLEEAGPELQAVHEDIRRRLLAVQAEANATAGPNMFRRRMYYFEIAVTRLEPVRELALSLNYPVVEEYDFKTDKNPVSCGDGMW